MVGGCLVFLVKVAMAVDDDAAAADVVVAAAADVDVTADVTLLTLAKICCVSLSALSHGKVRFFCVTF